MPDLVYLVAVSLDGRIAGPDGDFGAFPAEGDLVDWLVREHPDTLPGPVRAALGVTGGATEFGTVVMGWETYAVGLPVGQTDPYPHLEQVVATHREVDLPAGVRRTDDPLTAVRHAKAHGDRDVWLCGGGVLAAQLVDEIDRLVLKVNPVVLGAGRPLFAGAYDPRRFTLDRSTPFASGVVVQEYRR